MRKAFKRRNVLIFLGAFAAIGVLNLPAAIQSALDSRAAEAWGDLALVNLPKPTTRHAIEAWLKSEAKRHTIRYWIGTSQRRRDGDVDTGILIVASRLLSQGSLLTDPAHADLRFFLRSDDTLMNLEVDVRPFLPPLSNVKRLPRWPRALVTSIIFYGAILWIWIPIMRRKRRLRHNLCLECGYDLRGNLAAGCPECGWRREAAS